jgi:hypothetical protein
MSPEGAIHFITLRNIPFSNSFAPSGLPFIIFLEPNPAVLLTHTLGLGYTHFAPYGAEDIILNIFCLMNI